MLGYGRPLPWRRRLRRRMYVAGAVTLCLLVGLSAAAVVSWPRWGPRAWEVGRLLYRQHRCLAYHQPSHTLVFVEPPDLHVRLQAEGAKHQESGKIYDLAAGVPADTAPACLADLAAAHEAYQLHRRNPHAIPIRRSWPTRRTVVFLHGRTTPAGQECLVVLELTGSASRRAGVGPVDRHLWFEAHVIARGTASQPPRQLGFGGGQWTFLSGADREAFRGPFRFYAGQPDLGDATHFMVRYEYEGKEGTLDWHLKNDGSLTVSVRDGPARRQLTVPSGCGKLKGTETKGSCPECHSVNP